MDNYSQLVDRISRAANVEVEDVERKIEAKRAKLSGLISKEGAAQIVAAELGITFDNELLKISELVEGMKRAHVIGKITEIFPIRSYNKNGREGKIGSFLLGDESSNVRVVLWDMHHIGLIESGGLRKGGSVEILNAGVRNGELHLGAFSDIKESNQTFDSVKEARELHDGKLVDAKPGDKMKVRATIVQVFDPKYFDDKKDGRKRALVNMIIDDGTETMRCLANEEKLLLFGFNQDDVFSLESFNGKKGELLGEEKLFFGSFKTNSYFNKIEMNVDSVAEVNVDELISELEKG